MDFFKEDEKIVNFKVYEEGLDIKGFLGKQKLSSRLFRKLYSNKHIYVNGKFLRKGIELNKGDVVSIYMPDEEDTTDPEDIELDIVYEDHDLLIINKQPNMVVHLTGAHQKYTLSNGIANYFAKNNIKRKIRFINRLDIDTTGLVVVAKNQFAHQQMALQFQANKVERKYLAIVSNVIDKNEEYIDLPIEREEEKSMKRIVRLDGQRALTRYNVIERYKNSTLVEIQIYTGRCHQIRVHLSHIGYPIIGDSLYGGESDHINRQALHSYYLKMKQPRTNRFIEIKIPLPKDMLDLIEKTKNK